ncbi:DUF5590 domain-containing protein [Bacillus carboniphilus]|uniref:DUF5590 domain-containing protein n=1 Tax=Bacillus carboniphilus TaxID=86663 RepID=A0ABY9JWD4_9BACI|nr:DUF5590 domain-containing protein [Bacillus carboniphilus]WLR43707.1 DUF5590 domain-containing protein [Bacillus carboniphilus]
MSKKSLFIFIVIILILAGLSSFTYIYTSAIKDKKSGHEEAEHIALKDEEVEKIVEINTYHGEEKYYVITATDSNSEEFYVFIQDGKVYDKVYKSKGISQEKAISLLKADKNPKEINGISLGVSNYIHMAKDIDEKYIAWEIQYKDQDNRLSYYYLKFENGEFIQSMTI